MGTHRLRDATHDRCVSPAASHVTSINSAISTSPSDTSVHPKSKSVAQSSVTSLSGHISQPKKAQVPSTQASVSRSSGLPTGAIDSRLSFAVRRKATLLSRREVSPASSSTHKKQHQLNSMGHPTDQLYTQLSHEISDQASMTFATPQGPASIYTCEKPAEEATYAHCLVENPCGSENEIARGAHMYSIILFGAKLIVFPQLLYRKPYPRHNQL